MNGLSFRNLFVNGHHFGLIYTSDIGYATFFLLVSLSVLLQHSTLNAQALSKALKVTNKIFTFKHEETIVSETKYKQRQKRG